MQQLTTNPKILLCDDNQILHDTLGAYFDNEGYSYVSAFDGDDSIDKFLKHQPDLILLDVMMPNKTGLEVCKEIRKTSSVPIIMLTAKGEEIDKVLGLELGADDYIVKPFSPREVLARIKAVLRRTNDQHSEDSSVLRYDRLEINQAKYEVLFDGQTLPFTPKEVSVLYFLASSPGQVFDREQILSKIWGYDYFGDTRVVDTQIKRIRQKLPQDNVPWGIKSIYGVGYKFEVKK